jgi:hypothetical protein
MTREDLERLEETSPAAQLAVLLRTVEQLRTTAIEAVQVWMTVSRDERLPSEVAADDAQGGCRRARRLT